MCDERLRDVGREFDTRRESSHVNGRDDLICFRLNDHDLSLQGVGDVTDTGRTLACDRLRREKARQKEGTGQNTGYASRVRPE